MVTCLIIIGAMFFIAGKVSGLAALLWGANFQFYLRRRHEAIFSRLAALGEDPAECTVSFASLWKYINSPEDNTIPEILQYKNKIKKFFIIFTVLCMTGISLFLAAAVVLIVLYEA